MKDKPLSFAKQRAEAAKKNSSVRIEKVNNGFVVSGYKGDYENEFKMIAKSEKEAKAIASRML